LRMRKVCVTKPGAGTGTLTVPKASEAGLKAILGVGATELPVATREPSPTAGERVMASVSLKLPTAPPGANWRVTICSSLGASVNGANPCGEKCAELEIAE